MTTHKRLVFRSEIWERTPINSSLETWNYKLTNWTWKISKSLLTLEFFFAFIVFSLSDPTQSIATLYGVLIFLYTLEKKNSANLFNFSSSIWKVSNYFRFFWIFDIQEKNLLSWKIKLNYGNCTKKISNSFFFNVFHNSASIVNPHLRIKEKFVSLYRKDGQMFYKHLKVFF